MLRTYFYDGSLSVTFGEGGAAELPKSVERLEAQLIGDHLFFRPETQIMQDGAIPTYVLDSQGGGSSSFQSFFRPSLRNCGGFLASLARGVFPKRK